VLAYLAEMMLIPHTLMIFDIGFGIRTNPKVHEICRCAGIDDLSAKVMGSRNPINVVKATFEALQLQRTPEQLARARGLRVHDVRKLVFGQ
jgi:small subunit ribosomal protein S5